MPTSGHIRKQLEDATGLSGDKLENTIRSIYEEISKQTVVPLDQKKLYTYQEAALITGISVPHLQNEIRLGRGPRLTRLGNAVRISRSALDEWVTRWEFPEGEDAEIVEQFAARLHARAKMAGNSQNIGRRRA